MISPPEYFGEIRSTASRMWDQLDADSHLAGPWHQLFRQVQSPRHVLSELLQNADDAGATEAAVSLQGDEFVFSHNGEDFEAEHFASLCRFGYSNKRALHTIGFRGVGFKSTFSLGGEVRLFTPTLSVAFRKRRFTEPVWLETHHNSGRTEVRVPITDSHRKIEVEKNLEEWFRSPASLLFFRCIRSLRIGEREVRWEPRGAGPVEDSECMGLTTELDKSYLLIRSAGEEFREDALEEIRSERMLSMEEDMAFPPCRVEIVLGLEGRLFVILPTGVKTELPFACNAPFVQDPARLKIKDPETSPTNRWLLERLGKLAAGAMLGWLKRNDLPLEGRCDAYDLFPDVNRDEPSIEGSCAAIVERAFESALEDQFFLLTEDKLVAKWGECVAVPETILDVWSTDQVKAFFVDAEQSILCRQIGPGARKKLIHWGCVEEREKSSILESLVSKHLPKPASRKLLILWEYLSSDIAGYYFRQRRKDLRIFPVRGKEVLYSAKELVRLGEDRLLKSQEDWEFLAPYLLVIDQNWPRFLTKQRREAEERGDQELEKRVASASAVLSALGHDQASDMSLVIGQVSKKFFSQEACSLEDCVRLAQLAATFGASAPEDFQFVTRDRYRRPVNQQILADLSYDLDTFVEADWYEGHVLADHYTSNFVSCSKTEWESWISSGRSKLLTFPPLIQSNNQVWGRERLVGVLKGRGLKSELHWPYVTSNFILSDWDFDAAHWAHWKELAEEDESLWGRVLERVMKQPKDFWSKALSAKALQVATTGTRQQVTQEQLLPAWIIKFRDLPCLQDTRGTYHQPAELLMRTSETESLLEVEPFVRSELDNEAIRPLLAQLGVRDTPTGPERLLERLGTLSLIENPPVYEVEKWYHRLDQMVTKCSSDELQEIKTAFETKKIILTEDKQWARAGEVFIARDDEDVPGAAVVFPGVRHLALWQKVGVEDRPTVELAINWLKSLPSGHVLAPDELRRVRSLLPRHPERIWNECEHWLNLEGEWTPKSNLAYALTMQSLVAWKHLFTETKQKTADLQKLTTEICQQHPFSGLPTLANSIEERFVETLFSLPPVQHKAWLTALGLGLRRVLLETEIDTNRVRELADRLAKTKWQIATGLETIPYIGGTPAGTARRIDVLWKESQLYVEDRSTARMAKNIAQELGRVFDRSEVTDAIKLCYDRSPEFVMEYLQENFRLSEEVLEQERETVDDLGQSEPSWSSSDTGGQAESSEPDQHEVNQQDSEGLAQESDEAPALEQPATQDEVPDEPTPTRTYQPKPPKLSLIERFARSRGFSKDGDDRYYHPDGRSISKANGMRFPWELYSASGDLLKCYWPKEHCIQEEPLQLAAEIWSLCDKSPAKYSLVLADSAGAPVEVSGDKLKKMCDCGELSLHPATYRLVYSL
jgi:hypothetical protein